MNLGVGILAIALAVGGGGSAEAFVMPSSGCSLSRQHHAQLTRSLRSSTRRHSSTSVYFRDDDSFDGFSVERAPKKRRSSNNKSAADAKPPPSDFQSRMKRLVVKNNRSTTQRKNPSLYRPKNVKSASSLEEFATVIEEGRRDGRVVVVRFYATWCKTCHSLRPSFDKAASTNPDVIFLDVPVLETNSNLHQGLGVESVPFGHIYHPERGLVEETKLSRKTFAEFESLVKMHCS